MKYFYLFIALSVCFYDLFAQCTKDTDCKGNRICIDGKCVDPSSQKNNAAPAAPQQPSVSPNPAAPAQEIATNPSNQTGAATGFSQSPSAASSNSGVENSNWQRYKDERKSPFGAVVLGLFFPSMGHLWAENWPRGLIFLGANATLWGTALLCTNGFDDDDAVLWIVISSGVIHLLSVGDAVFCTINHNKKLQVKLGIEEISFNDHSIEKFKSSLQRLRPQIALVYGF